MKIDARQPLFFVAGGHKNISFAACLNTQLAINIDTLAAQNLFAVGYQTQSGLLPSPLFDHFSIRSTLWLY
jgi:hypothetical protein